VVFHIDMERAGEVIISIILIAVTVWKRCAINSFGQSMKMESASSGLLLPSLLLLSSCWMVVRGQNLTCDSRGMLLQKSDLEVVIDYICCSCV